MTSSSCFNARRTVAATSRGTLSHMMTQASSQLLTALHTAAPTTKAAAATKIQARPDEAIKVQPVASYADGADGDEQKSRTEPSYHQLVAIAQQQPAEDISRSAAQQDVISGSALKPFQQSSEADEKMRQHCLAI